MNNTIFAARKPRQLVRMWHSTGDPGTPLVCTWLLPETAKLLSNSTTDETGGLLLCA